MISITVKAIAALLAAQKVPHQFVDDSNPIVFIPLKNDSAIMVYYEPKLQAPAVVHSTHMPIPEPVRHAEEFSKLLWHIVKQHHQTRSQSRLEALQRKPEILALAWSA